MRAQPLSKAFQNVSPRNSWGEVPATYLELVRPIQTVQLQRKYEPLVQHVMDPEGSGRNTTAATLPTGEKNRHATISSVHQRTSPSSDLHSNWELSPVVRDTGNLDSPPADISTNNRGRFLKVLHDFNPPVRVNHLALFEFGPHWVTFEFGRPKWNHIVLSCSKGQEFGATAT